MGQPTDQPWIVEGCRKVLRFALIAAACLSTWVSAAHAYDWSAKATATETVELNDNRLLRVQPLGNSYNSYSNLLFDAHALGPTSKFDFSGGLTYRAYSGPGEATTLNALDNFVSSRFETSPTKLTTFYVLANRREAESSTIQLEETGFATLTGSTITSSYGGGFKHDFNSTNSIASQTTLTTTDFTLNNGTPITSLTTVLTGTHKATPTTVFMPSLQFQDLQYDNATQSEVTFWRAALAMTKNLTPQLDFHGEVGGTFLDAQQGNPGAATTALTNPAGLASGKSTDWIANAFLTYRFNNRTTFSVAASKNVGPTTFGQFLATQTVSGSVSYIINSYSGLSFAAAYSQQSSVGASASSANTISASASYSRQLTRYWRSIATYRYVQREGTDGTASSNALIFSLSRDAIIIP